jgi:hypothetical protein
MISFPTTGRRLYATPTVSAATTSLAASAPMPRKEAAQSVGQPVRVLHVKQVRRAGQVERLDGR